jgi:DNA-binding transcriptional LysR family regulator
MFVQVVRAGSFAEAARRLGVPANTLSRRIRQLESGMGTRLMQRSTRNLTLTAAGSAFFERCAPAVDGVVDAGRELAGATEIATGTVRVAAPIDFFDFFKLEWVAEFLARYPKVRLDFVLSDARADLIAEAIDVAFRGGAAGSPHLVHRQLMSQSFKLVASPEYIQSRGLPDSLPSLAAHECLTVSGPPAPLTWTLRGPGGSEQTRVSGRFRANSARVLLNGCLAGMGIALLPSMLVDAHLHSGSLVHVLPGYWREGADLNVILPSGRLIPTAVSAFVEFAAAKFESMMAG